MASSLPTAPTAVSQSLPAMFENWTRFFYKARPTYPECFPTPDLPIEIWLLIGSYIQPEQTELRVIRRGLLSLSSTCRYFRQIFQPFLFKRIYPQDWVYHDEPGHSGPSRMHLLFKSFLERPELASYIHEAYIADILFTNRPSRHHVRAHFRWLEQKWLSKSQMTKARMLLYDLIKEPDSVISIGSQIDLLEQLQTGKVALLAVLILSQLKNVTDLSVLLTKPPVLSPRRVFNLSSIETIEICCPNRDEEGYILSFRATENVQTWLEEVLPLSRKLKAFNLHGCAEHEYLFADSSAIHRALNGSHAVGIERLTLDIYLWPTTQEPGPGRMLWLPSLPFFANLRSLSLQLELLLGHPWRHPPSLHDILPARLEEFHILRDITTTISCPRIFEPLWNAARCLEQVTALVSARNCPGDTYLRVISIESGPWTEGERMEMEALRQSSNVQIELHDLYVRPEFRCF